MIDFRKTLILHHLKRLINELQVAFTIFSYFCMNNGEGDLSKTIILDIIKKPNVFDDEEIIKRMNNLLKW